MATEPKTIAPAIFQKRMEGNKRNQETNRVSLIIATVFFLSVKMSGSASVAQCLAGRA